MEWLARGNEEVGQTVKKGDWIVFGEHEGKLQYGKDMDGKESDVIGYIKVKNGKTYLVAVQNQLLKGCRRKT